MNKTLKNIVFGAALAVVTSSVFAVDYQLHTSDDSTTVDVNVEIPKMVAITKPSDMSLMTFSGKGDLEATSNFCIASNIDQPTIKLRISDENKGKYFMLNQQGAAKNSMNDNNQLGYEVSYSNGANGADTPVIFSNGESQRVRGAKWLSDCIANPQTGSTVTVKVKEAAAQHVFSGTYSSTLTLTVYAE